jgi:hypothetical protein
MTAQRAFGTRLLSLGLAEALKADPRDRRPDVHRILPPWMLGAAYQAYEATRPGQPMRYIIAGVGLWILVETFPGD